MKSNLKKLDVGLRGTLDEFKATYTLGFLKKNGFQKHMLLGLNGKNFGE